MVSGFGSLAFLVGNVLTDRRNSLISLGLLIASYPVYRLARREDVRRKT
jgi:hypothetical protein